MISQRDFEDTCKMRQCLAEVIFDVEEISARIFTAHMELGDHHFKVPDCPVTYNGDDKDYIEVRLYREWFYEYPFRRVGEACPTVVVQAHCHPFSWRRDLLIISTKQSEIIIYPEIMQNLHWRCMTLRIIRSVRVIILT